MAAPPLPAAPVDLVVIRAEVESVLAAFVERKATPAVTYQMPTEITEVLKGLLFAGGKRLRPVLCVAGWYAASGHGDIVPVLKAAASLGMFHTFTLIHDDVMDDSTTRRGRGPLAMKHWQPIMPGTPMLHGWASTGPFSSETWP
ncbi:polyprenyl synthetase family protein [Streptomyces sp. NPDC050147]|uniref:polyprenyl synthetase family protein n=1 Tax=Streptomyces sp. NPDC050147 TaxID=3155513 RepID=UPI00341FC962